MKLTLLSIGFIIIIVTVESSILFDLAGVGFNVFIALLLYSIGVLLMLISVIIKGKWL